MGGTPTELKEIEDRVMYNLHLYDKIDEEKVVYTIYNVGFQQFF